MLQPAVDLDHLVLRIQVKANRHRLTLVLRRGHPETDRSIVGPAPGIDVPPDVQRDRVRPTCRNLHHALQARHELRLGHRLEDVLRLAEAEHTVLITAHRVDIAILREQVCLGLSAGYLLDEDVVAAHFGPGYDMRVPLLLSLVVLVWV